MSNYLALYDYRSQVAASYRERNRALCAGEDAAVVLRRFRESKDHLFLTHSQSALDEEQRRHFHGLRYFPYNPAMCFAVTIDTHVEPKQQHIAMDARESMTMTTIGLVRFTVGEIPVELSVYWLNIYGGGMFLPFRDATYTSETYGSGRYLFDTIKGSDPVPFTNAQDEKQIILDFNYAYNPSCSYNDRWVCPLAPAENRLDVPIPAGEKNYKEERS
ncbi:DUF1684 domain-containing protein [Dictyobacter formicarum]|uniref:DUF1684 domain-containing protein n=1 Tax=Dictyobacter formicarum TaxID=2778368 RepID=A0ABQ3VV49_9CHLR|nr:DUF1684 domain-containing protein [Dictyobacter formicarum]GHO89438.1 hypothetical protein KSZ_74440 [Dictyobacter formicarum]